MLKRVLEEGAYVNLALSTTLDRSVGMSAQDKGFLTELVYGTLRHLAVLDRALALACGRPLKKVDLALLHLARIAAYEALILQGADHALVNESVEAARRIRGVFVADPFKTVDLKDTHPNIADSEALNEVSRMFCREMQIVLSRLAPVLPAPQSVFLPGFGSGPQIWSNCIRPVCSKRRTHARTHARTPTPRWF